MELKITSLVVLFTVAATLTSAAQDDRILIVNGRGVEGRPPYRDGGVVQFIKVFMDAQIVHFQPERQLNLPLSVEYNVIEPAPILLTSRLGTEHWLLYHFDNEHISAMYTDEKIDLATSGKHTAEASRAWFGKNYGPLPEPGLVGIRGHRYLLIDRPDGRWLDVANPPAFLNQTTALQDLTFTLADLSDYQLTIDQIQSTWKPNGPLRIRLAIRDGQGKVLPVVGAPLIVNAGTWQTDFTTEWTSLGEPTGYMRVQLPPEIPAQIEISGSVALQTPDGLRAERIATTVPRGKGQVTADHFQIAEQDYQLPRDENGTRRETRAVWISPNDFTESGDIDRLVQRCKQAGLNVLVPDIFVRNAFYAQSDLMPMADAVAPGSDRLGELISKAHAADLEVHPWFCVTYRDRHFRKWFADRYGATVDMIDPDGDVISLGADVHRPEYRQFIVDLMIDVAQNYDVDGIHLDYIRTMGRCHCSACRNEFAQKHGGDLTEAPDPQWTRWQREAIADIVKRTSQGVRKVRPNATISAAVFANMDSGASQGQDPADWAKQDWLDLVIPMDYQMQTLQVRSNERRFLAAIPDDSRLVTGLSLYMRTGEGVQSRPPELLREQVELVRRMGIHGYCLFAFTHMSDEQVNTLQHELNTDHARPFYR